MRRALTAALTAVLTAGLLLAGPPGSAAPSPTDTAAGSTFTPLSPVRVLDTRAGAPAGPGGTVTVQLGTQVPAAATAVVLNVTGVTPTADTFVTVHPFDTVRPTASNLNLGPGDIRANQVTVALGASRAVSLYNHAGNTDLVVDLGGYYATGAGARFTALPPNRLLDTRADGGPLGPGTTRELDLTNHVPASATAVTVNLTATNPTSSTFVTAWPAGTARPTASSLNTPAADTRPNLVTVAVGANRKISLYNNAGSVDLIVDLAGFYTPDYGASFFPRTPLRVLDSRDGTGLDGPAQLGPNDSFQVPVVQGAPLTATGVLVNVTGVNANQPTYVLAWGQWEPRPATGSTLNVPPLRAVANAAVIAFNRAPGMHVYNRFGSLDVLADLAGVFAVADPAPCTADCLVAWGNNFARKLGTGMPVTNSPRPTPVAHLSGVRAAAGSTWNGYALRTDGTVTAWGNNDTGQLGNGWTSRFTGGGSAVPAPVLGLTGITAIAAGGRTAFALRNDGTVWAWGDDPLGLLGDDGIQVAASVPVRVSGLTGVVSIATNGTTAYAVRGDGTVWAWGSNFLGALGTGTSVEVAPMPVQVSGLTGVTAIAAGGAAHALRSDGTVWAWGDNGDGQLGNGQVCAPDPSACESRVPVQVSGLTGVTSVASGAYNGYAVRGDGTAWAWGAGYSGRLGNGLDCATTQPCESRTPVQVSNLSNVTQVASFDNGGYAVRADGTVWAWGTNEVNSLGNESAPIRALVPVRVPDLVASRVAGAWYTGYAVVPNL